MTRCSGLAGAGRWLAWAVCLQAASLTPYVVLMPDDRTNLFTPLLCLLPLAALLAGPARTAWEGRRTLRSVLAWALLGLGLVVAALAGTAPLPSLWRAVAFYCPAAAGLACGLCLVRSRRMRDALFALLTLCFAGLAASHLVFGVQPSFLGLHHHALAGTMLLLSAGPMRLVGHERPLWRLAGWALLALGAAVCFWAGSRFVILLPFALVPIYTVFKKFSWRQMLAGVLCSLLVAGIFFRVFPEKVPRTRGYESTYYRIEAFPATWEIVKQHPLLGVGIRTPRKPFLENYQPVSGMATKEEFEGTLERNVTWDNQYLSLLCGIGVPLTLLYLYLAGRPLSAYLRRAWRQELDHATERALTFALLASVIHFTVHDGLFYPQINWFFHLLLGVGAALVKAPAAGPTLADDQPGVLFATIPPTEYARIAGRSLP